jgi:hypothetical protein
MVPSLPLAMELRATNDLRRMEWRVIMLLPAVGPIIPANNSALTVPDSWRAICILPCRSPESPQAKTSRKLDVL